MYLEKLFAWAKYSGISEYVQVGTQKFGRRTERDVQVKIILRITTCKVFWMRLNQLDVKTSGAYN